MSARHRAAAHDSWAATSDRNLRTQPARDGLLAKFEREVDPDRVMTPEARALAAESAKRAHFTRLAAARWGKKAT